ncbi:hypothetical protein BJ170DRAFT_324406 [Xylariales sp. AK1849]|nr:hypothetical protein BJ170DRAFT_324406 [Xylariales sp. AK1849]
MPDHNQTFFQQSGDAFTGDAFTNFGRGHGASASASACPFAPLRHNQGAANANANANPMVNAHHNHNSNLNPISTPSSLPQPSPYLVSAPLFQRSIATPARPSCGRDPNSDNFLSALASGDFSSPSLPPLNSSPRHPPPSSQLPSPNRFTLLPLQIHDNMPPTRGSASVSRTAASTRARRWSRSSVASTIDLTSPKSENTDALSGIDPATPMAPPSVRKRTRTTATGMSSAPRRRQSSTAKSRPVKPLRSLRKATAFDDDAFDSSSVIGKEEDDDVLDLTGADEVPAELLKPKVDNRIKLAKFQCVICMDEVSNLTVTHCGHLFCSVCLHSALHIDSTKKTCPVCRTKVDVKAKPGQKPSKNTFYHLELKLMTANRKGKLPARR